MSSLQGTRLADLLEARGLPWNAAWDGGPVMADRRVLPVVELAGGMRITVLGPPRDRIAALGDKWVQDVTKAGFDPGGQGSKAGGEWYDALGDEDDIDYPPHSSGTSPGDEELAEVAGVAADIGPLDESVPNLASIALLAEAGGGAVLLPSDARADDLEGPLLRLLDERGLERLPLDALVMPHGGSRNNLTRSFFDLIDCRTYLFSTNGDRFRHPHPEAVAAVLAYGRTDPAAPLTLVFNYRTESNVMWDSPELQEQYNYRAIYPGPGEAGIRIDIAGE